MEYNTNDLNELLTLALSTILPLLVSFFKDKNWSGQAKVILTLMLCFIFSVILVWLTTGDFSDILGTSVHVFAYTSIIYQFIYKNMKLNEVVTNIPSPFTAIEEKAPQKLLEARGEEKNTSIPEEVLPSLSEAPRQPQEHSTTKHDFQYIPGTF